jgi:hypothetical protein
MPITTRPENPAAPAECAGCGTWIDPDAGELCRGCEADTIGESRWEQAR